MKYLCFFPVVLFLNGCVSTSYNEVDNSNLDESFQQNRFSSYEKPQNKITNNNSGNSFKNINHYVKEMMHGLVDNLQYINSKTPIAVTSFVDLDGQLNSSSLLGNQLAESFIHEVHNFGVPVIDFKTTDFIRITPKGDLAFTRDFLELESINAIEYILSGTLVKHNLGYLVNVRIVGINSKAVVASSQGLIPSHIVNDLLASSLNDGIPTD